MLRAWTNCLLGIGLLFATSLVAKADERGAATPSHGAMTKVHRASVIIGLPVKNSADESLGRIDDILLDHNGKCHYAIVGDGGTLGIGENYIAVPPSKLTCDEANKVARLDMPKSKFQTAPAFKRANYYDRWTPEWCTKVHEFFGTTDTKKATDADKRDHEVFFATQFMKANVENNDSTKLAQVKDIIFDDNHMARFAILTHGGVLTVGGTETAAPWRAFKIRRGEKASMFVVLNMTAKQLEGAPVLKDKDYGELMNAQFVENAHRYYGVTDRREIETEKPNRPDQRNQ